MTRKTIALTISTFPGKGISLLFYMLYSLIVFLPRSRQLLSSWVHVIIHSDFGAQEKKICHCFHLFPFYLPWSDGTRCHDLSFLNVVLSQLFHSPLFTLTTRIFRSSLSAIRVISSAYLRLLTFLLPVLIPAYHSSSLAFHVMYCIR